MQLKRLSNVFGVLGVLFLLCAVGLSVFFRNEPARMVTDGAEARNQTEALMEAICAGDHAAVSELLLGNPVLDVAQETDSPLTRLLWDAYGSSISYEFSSDCYSDDGGLCRDVTVTVLDISGLMQQLKDEIPALVSGEAASCEPEAVYQEDGTYRDEFVMEVLSGAVADRLPEAPVKTLSLRLTMTCRDGKWLIQPDQTLLNIIAGGMGL